MKKIAQPLAAEEKLAKAHSPPHSALTFFSISFAIRESEISIMSALFCLNAVNILPLFGFFPILLGLNPNIFNPDIVFSLASIGI